MAIGGHGNESGGNNGNRLILDVEGNLDRRNPELGIGWLMLGRRYRKNKQTTKNQDNDAR